MWLARRARRRLPGSLPAGAPSFRDIFYPPVLITEPIALKRRLKFRIRTKLLPVFEIQPVRSAEFKAECRCASPFFVSLKIASLMINDL
jgi:hypothetical protein